VTEIPDDGRVIYDEPYLATYPQWEAPQEATPPFRSMTKPILTAVNGLCCGAGLDLVTTGDIVIASERAEFFDPHVSIGLVSGREVVRLARVLPLNVAMRIAPPAATSGSARSAPTTSAWSEVVSTTGCLSARARSRHRQPQRPARRPRHAPRDPEGLDLPLTRRRSSPRLPRRVVRTEDAREGPRASSRSGAEVEVPMSRLLDHPLRDDPDRVATITSITRR
jgi:enoyl-CoA hydratase/carnithine racemase